MHCYEVILEAAVCKLYFDLEFDKASNTHLDGKMMVSKLIQVSINYSSNVWDLSFFFKYITFLFSKDILK